MGNIYIIDKYCQQLVLYRVDVCRVLQEKMQKVFYFYFFLLYLMDLRSQIFVYVKIFVNCQVCYVNNIFELCGKYFYRFLYILLDLYMLVKQMLVEFLELYLVLWMKDLDFFGVLSLLLLVQMEFWLWLVKKEWLD